MIDLIDGRPVTFWLEGTDLATAWPSELEQAGQIPPTQNFLIATIQKK